MRWWVFLLFWAPLNLLGQNAQPEPKALEIESFGYPDFGKEYNFGDFSVEYALGDRSSLILKGMYQKSPAFEIFQGQLLFRQRLAQKLYGTGGLLVEWNLQSETFNPYMVDPKGDNARLEAFIGLEYEARPDILIHAGYGRLLNQPKFTSPGFINPQGKHRFILGSKFKL